jgi:hypothetical protein
LPAAQLAPPQNHSAQSLLILSYSYTKIPPQAGNHLNPALNPKAKRNEKEKKSSKSPTLTVIPWPITSNTKY